jgi:hypothetical protein
MLNNKDFAKFLSPAENSGGSGKTRFDLRQVRQWDQQIKSKQQHKAKPPGRPVSESTASSERLSDHSEYRDRAAERRREETTQELVGDITEAQARAFDIEKSKFLGGDIERTHLVKGLDYLLLKKTKQATAFESDEPAASDSSRAEEAVQPRPAQATVTALGLRLRAVLLQESLRAASAATTGKTVADMPVNVFARMAYEYDTDVLSSKELPTTVTRSAQVKLFNVFEVKKYIIYLDILGHSRVVTEFYLLFSFPLVGQIV